MKKLLVLLLITGMLVSLLAGCGKKDEQKNNGDDTTQSGNSGENSSGNSNQGTNDNTDNSGDDTGNNGEGNKGEETKPSWTIETLPESSAGLEFELNNDEKGYTVTGIGTCTATDIAIGKYNNLPVTRIGDNAFNFCYSLTSVTIGNSVTSIGKSAFKYCDSLTSVKFAENSKLESIDSYAFYCCDILTSIEIPNNVTSIGDSAFSDCDSLTSVTFENAERWWYSSDANATRGTSISSNDLANPSTAATYLTSTYDEYYWKRSSLKHNKHLEPREFREALFLN